jgi:hypothetical protein
MAKKKSTDKLVNIVPEAEYIPELEEQVQYYMRITPESSTNKKVYKRVPKPVFTNDSDRKEWEREEIRRCKKGHDGLCGKMYFYFHYGKIKDISGVISVEFRMVDNEWFELITTCQTNDKGEGVICVKRRRVGASWKEAADVLQDAMFHKFFTVGMNSKTETDSIELFKKVKFMYSQLPSFLRASVLGNTKLALMFAYKAKDENGNPILKGNQSEIICKAPTDSAFEGMLLQKWVCDEAGKIDNLKQLWSFTEPALMQETHRAGTPVLFGTSGEVSGAGKGLQYMWDKNKAYKLKRFFFAGYSGLIVDQYGNDAKEEGIRWIVYERYKKRELDPKTYNDFVQQFPLTVEEAFSPALTGGVGDQVKIVKQRSSLLENPFKATKGNFILTDEGTVRFMPNHRGKCIVYEHPKKYMTYVSGCDPADHDDARSEASDLSMYIMCNRIGVEPPKVVFEFTDRPSKLNDYYHQTVCALIYFNNTKILIERNRYRMIDYFEQQGHKALLSYTPQGVLRLYTTRRPVQIGVHMGTDAKKFLEDLIAEYVDDYCEYIPSVELLDEFIDYGAKNTDRAMAFGITLMLLKENSKSAERQQRAAATQDIRLPTFDYKVIRGRVQRTNK